MNFYQKCFPMWIPCCLWFHFRRGRQFVAHWSINWTLVAERIHVGRNNADRAVFLEKVTAIEEHRWIDIDETAASAAEFEAKYGWAPRGRACNFQRFVIDNRRFSAVAAYTTLRFLCWQIVEGTFDSGAFMEFVNNELALSV